MGFKLKLRARLDEDIKRVAREQLGGALECLGDSADASAVHTARKRLKMLRAIVRLVRDPLGSASYEEERAAFREAGRRLSPMRDADVLLSTIDGLKVDKECRAALDALRTQMASERETRVRSLTDEIAFARETAQAALGRVDDWPLGSLSVGDLLDGFTRSYARGRKAFRAALGTHADDELHEWRKRAKDLWYHLRLLRKSWPRLTAEWAAEAHRLTDRLGDDHDLAVLMERMTEAAQHRAAFGGLDAAILERRKQLQAEAQVLGTRMYAEKRRPLRRRMRRYIDARRLEQKAHASEDATGPAA